ncbi:MAG: glycyl-radical enzyme activating protein [Desulfarculaceae bacterium]|nr:glycyl-radical enzyme activating protein [Desulfarculaceae bacterium]MCF8071515.1 glycyl-radical enzyme activating protein [Desulfarculaceae bacterium]MCF8102330.1 glycyl-radical enzyme activating protein [Desulfarculaceae bacterium]MCF8114794.1 glycyl-radical enzyme activating protein [Desulfarculaceae bacterium]
MASEIRSGRPLIIDIKGNSLDDGPGTRSVVFMKGCPLNCAWCQNPESKKIAPELWFETDKCVSSGECVPACPEGALGPGDPLVIDRDKCTLCFDCVAACPSTALRRVGQDMTVEQVVAKIAPYKPFFDTTGGGVTLSGGEPTLFMEFTSQLLQALKQEGIPTLVETAGLFNFDAFAELVLPYCDIIYMDIKLIDPELHKRWCGVDNTRIKENFIRLHQMAASGGFSIKPRTPLIPGLTDTDQLMADLAGFYLAHGVKLAALEKNNPIWFDKSEKVGVEPDFAPDDPARGFYDNERYALIKKYFEDQGITILES